MTNLKKIFAVGTLAAASALTGCATVGQGPYYGGQQRTARDVYTTGGAGAGALGAALLTKNPLAIIGAAVLGAAVGHEIAPPCTVRQTTTTTVDENGHQRQSVQQTKICSANSREFTPVR